MTDVNKEDFYDKYPDFVWNIYLSYNNDLNFLNNEEKAYKHYFFYGFKQKRKATISDFKKDFPNFDWNFYIKYNTDLLSFCTNEILAIEHFLKFGKKEDRCYSPQILEKKYPDFDYIFYTSVYQDVSCINNHLDALIHYDRYSKDTGRSKIEIAVIEAE